MSERVPVQAIREALAKATPGEWQTLEVETVGQPIWFLLSGEDNWLANDLTDADAKLIVLLRNNAEALLDTLEAAQKAVPTFPRRAMTVDGDDRGELVWTD